MLVLSTYFIFTCIISILFRIKKFNKKIQSRMYSLMFCSILYLCITRLAKKKEQPFFELIWWCNLYGNVFFCSYPYTKDHGVTRDLWKKLLVIKSINNVGEKWRFRSTLYILSIMYIFSIFCSYQHSLTITDRSINDRIIDVKIVSRCQWGGLITCET